MLNEIKISVNYDSKTTFCSVLSEFQLIKTSNY